MEVYVIRHTAVAVAPGICYGQTDVPVAETFIDDVRSIQKKLPEFEGIDVYSSPLRRCRQLADALQAGNVVEDPRLMEMDFGAWEGQPWDALQGGQITAWMEDFVRQPCTEGESYQHVFERAAAFWDERITVSDQTILVVTHGGVIRALLAHWLEIPLQHTMRVSIDFGGVTKVRQTSYGPVVDYVNR